MKGAITIYGVIMVVVMLIVFSYLLPIVTQSISYLSNNVTGVDDSTKSVASLFPFFILLAILMGLFYTATQPSYDGY